MSLFHIAIAGNVLSIMDAATGYTIERPMNEVPEQVKKELRDRVFRTDNLGVTRWTRTGVRLAYGSEIKHYFLYEKAEEKRIREEMEEERMSFMGMFASCFGESLETAYQ